MANADFNEDYLSLTDFARRNNPHEPKDVVKNWLRLRSTIEFLGLWEQLYNPEFKGVEFDTFKNESGSNAFTLTPQRRRPVKEAAHPLPDAQSAPQFSHFIRIAAPHFRQCCAFAGRKAPQE